MLVEDEDEDEPPSEDGCGGDLRRSDAAVVAVDTPIMLLCSPDPRSA
jgi:hypothetical protein